MQSPAGLAAALARSSSAPDTAALDEMQAVLLLLAAALVWAVLGWAALVALIGGLALTPGGIGTRARSTIRVVAPRGVRQILLAGVGASLITGLAACGTASSMAGTPGASPASGQSVLGVSAAHGPRNAETTNPTSSPVGTDRGVPSPPSRNSPTSTASASASATPSSSAPPGGPPPGPRINIDWPAGADPTTTASSATTPVAPTTGRKASARQTAAQAASGRGRAAAGEPLVVLRGDTLWSIASAQLPAGSTAAQINSAWRAWYAANKSVIGGNPNLILPGQRLVRPAASPAAPDGTRSSAVSGTAPAPSMNPTTTGVLP